VRFKDLNLDRPHDVARLFSRISSAAEKVCGPRFFDGLYSKPADFEICYTDAIGRAVAEIDRPALTAYFEQRSSHSASPNITIAKQ
jgi:UrcA family protein